MSLLSQPKVYSLKKSKRILRQAFHLVQKKKRRLPPETLTLLKEALLALQSAILVEKEELADELAKQIESLLHTHLRKTGWEQLKELVFALGFALIVAVAVRQMWFEFYEIPTGSMRPTFKEQDRLVVSKTNFGINMPLQPNEIYFNPDLVESNNIVIFTGENMDIRDVDTMYFYLFPGKKQYVKRLIGKPGDVLYFYGGLIYGIDQQGKDITTILQPEDLAQIDHVPFIDFERKVVMPPAPTNGIYSPVFIYQMDEPVVKLLMTPNHQVKGEMKVPSQIHSPGAPPVADYGDLWGIKNYALVRLLTRDQVKTLTDQDPLTMSEGMLYLEIRHHPTLSSVKLIRDEQGRMRPTFGLSTSILPLDEQHLKEIFHHLYTARFEVKDGIAFRYGSDPAQAAKNIFSPRLPQVPDGVYEFYHGKARQILWQGITKTLPSTHPLYKFDPALVQLLFNLGIEWDTRFSPQVKNQRLFPSRYAYYRFGDLYLMGAPILHKHDVTLAEFLKREDERKVASNPQSPYQPFADMGPPIKADGSLDLDLITQNGLMIPPKMYLVLGDNYAMSSDSRDFGFVPETNLRGGPDFIFWPPGERWGAPNQPGYPFFNLPRTIIWAIAALCILASILYWNKRNRLPLAIEKL